MKHDDSVTTPKRRAAPARPSGGNPRSPRRQAAGLSDGEVFVAPVDERRIVSLAGLTQAAASYLTEADVKRAMPTVAAAKPAPKQRKKQGCQSTRTLPWVRLCPWCCGACGA